MAVCPACGEDVPLAGVVIAGKYRITDLIGEGAMGRVYRAEQIPLGKPFAVKVLSPRLLSDAESSARFAREAHAAANLNHPNCVSVVDYGQDERLGAYIVMEFIEGSSLEQIIARDHPLDRSRVVDFTLQILDALSEAHGLGILHRDLKPENILVQRLRTHGELLKVVDFGIAQLMNAEEAQHLTRQSVVCGTPEYMSPEQARGLPLDGRSDLYAVGCILYQMLTGRPPFERASAVEVLHCHLHEAPIPPSRLLGTSPDALEAICLRALAKNPDDRFEDALAFRRAVQAAARAGTAARACPACGAQVDAAARFCSSCGAAMAAAPAGKAHKRPTRRSGLNLVRGTSETTADLLRRTFPLPLVGRRGLLDRIGRMLADDACGHRGLVLAGPDGIGKTRLADEAAALAEAHGYQVFYVGRDPTLADAPLWPIRAMVGQILGLDPATCTTVDLGRAANLVGVAVEALPGLAELFGLEGPAAPLEHRVRRRECEASVLQALLAGGGARTFLVFDDVDRYDPASRRILRRFAAAAAPQAVRTLFLTAEADASWMGVDVAAVDRLDRDEIQRTLVTDRMPASVRAMVERALADQPRIAPIVFDLRLRLLLTGREDVLDGSTEDLAAARIGALCEDSVAARVLAAAAVLGERVPEAALLALVDGYEGVTRGQAAEALSRLHTEGVLLVAGQGERAFAHRVLQQAAYQRLGRNDRARLHRRALLTHDFRGRFDATVRARHATSGRSDRVFAALAEAARFAEASFDDTGAADLVFAALSVPPSPQTPADARADLAAGLGRFKLDPARRRRAEALLDRTLEADGPDVRPKLAVALGRLCLSDGRFEDAIERFHDALGPLIAQGALERILAVYRHLGLAHVRAGRVDKAFAELEEGLDLCTLGEGPAATTELSLWRYLLAMAEAARVAGRLGQARDWAEHALAQAERGDDGVGRMRCHALLAWLVREQGQRARARVHVVSALSEARHFGDRLTTAELLLERARLAAADGDLDTRRQSLAEAARLSDLLGWRAGANHARKLLADLDA